MIVKERIQKADGTIKFRSYLKQDKLGKGYRLVIQVDSQTATSPKEWRTRNNSHSRSSPKNYSKSPRPNKKYPF